MTAGLGLWIARGGDQARGVNPFEVAIQPDRGLALMTWGIIVLALTPAVRVVALAIIWRRERDWRFVATALAVVVTLLVAVVLGRG